VAGIAVACVAATGAVFAERGSDARRSGPTAFETSVSLHVTELPSHVCVAATPGFPQGVHYRCPHGARDPIPAGVLAAIGLP